jgi:hypothetical protein
MFGRHAREHDTETNTTRMTARLLNDAAGAALTDTKTVTPPSGEHIVYYRPDKRVRWEPVALAETHAEAVGLIGVGGRRNGDWLIRPAQAPSPNDGERSKPAATPSLPLG